MTASEPEQRLSRISTRWSMVFQAHGSAAGEVPSARHALLQRYHPVVYRYILGAVRDPEVAEELCQEFALRLVRGDFHRADPDRGRFRDYLKKALIHLVTDYQRQQQHWPRQMAENAPEPAAAMPPDSEQDYLHNWREEILNRTWQSLASDNTAYYQVLFFRIENPDLSSSEAAEQLSARLEKPVTSDWVRKNAERAQKKFADLLLDEVSGLLETPTLEDLENELRELDLLRFCRSALQRRRDQG